MRLISLAWIGLALCACRSERSTAPLGTLTGTYVLRSINGVALPAMGNGASMTDFTMIADTLHLYDSGQGVEVSVTTRAGVAGTRVQSERFRTSWPSAGTLEIAYYCADGDPAPLASCIAAPHHQGAFTATGLTLSASVLYRAPLMYERVGGSAP